MTSRFFAGSTSTASESGTSDSGSSTPQEAAQGRAQRRFDFFDSSSDDEKKRVVRSTTDKRSQELDEIIKKMNNAIKINDWKEIADHYQLLQLKVQKTANHWEKMGGLPKSYWRAIVTVDEHLQSTLEDKAVVKKMNGTSAKSLNKMKQQLRKFTKAKAAKIKAYKEHPEESVEGTSTDSDEETSDSEGAAPAEPSPKKKVDFFGSDSDSDSEHGPDSWSSDDGQAPAAKPEEGAKKSSFWYKEDSGSDDDKKKKTRKDKTQRKKKEKGLKEEKKKELVPEDSDKVMEEIREARGKRGTDANDSMGRLHELLALDLIPEKRVEVLLLLISIQFDINANLFAYLPVDTWTSCVVNFSTLLDLLQQHPHIVVDPNAEDLFPMPKEGEVRPEKPEPAHLMGNIGAYLERLDDEYTKSLRSIEPQKMEYVDRLKDDVTLALLCTRVMGFLDAWDFAADAAAVAMRRIEHIYYKRPDVADARKESIAAAVAKGGDAEEEKETDRVKRESAEALVASEDQSSLLHTLCIKIYKDGDERLRGRAMLCHIYHHALYDRFFEARDFLLMSHLQDSIHTIRDVSTQILFNRAMVQLGLCAFRNGLVVEAHNCLSEICSSGRVKELLAQGITQMRFSERNPDQEKVEKRRLVPYHMHINLDMLECVHLTCAMLLEVPHMAANERETKRRVISKHFRRYFFDRQASFIGGPPEMTRDYVIAAARHLASGEVQQCLDVLLGLDCWALLSNSDAVKEMVTRKVKEEGLRTYLFTYSMYYDSISQKELESMFDLPAEVVHSVVSKMIIQEELHASWDQPSACIIVHRTEPTRLQFLALQFAEKASAMVENNEKLLDVRSGGYGGKFDKKGGEPRAYSKPYATTSWNNRTSVRPGLQKSWN